MYIYLANMMRCITEAAGPRLIREYKGDFGRKVYDDRKDDSVVKASQL